MEYGSCPVLTDTHYTIQHNANFPTPRPLLNQSEISPIINIVLHFDIHLIKIVSN